MAKIDTTDMADVTEMKELNFIFDIIVKGFAAPSFKAEDYSKLKCEVYFNKRKLIVTSSRINVNEFNPFASKTFREVDMVLRQNLEECGMKIIVKLDGFPLGTGQVKFPDELIGTIKDGMPDLILEDSCTISKKNVETGTLEFKCRLVVKCDNVEQRECRRNMDESINPHDIMFIMGATWECPYFCESCPEELEPAEGDEQLKLDLTRYESIDVPVSDIPIPPNDKSISQTITRALKQMALECAETIDSILKGTNPPMQIQLSEIAKPTVISRKAAQPVTHHDHQKNLADQIPGVEPIRFCSMCLNSMSWMPKLAACPNCGAKPTPLPQKRLRTTEPTADEIIMEYLGKPQPTVEDYCLVCDENGQTLVSKDECPQRRCTCKGGKLCAHCRVREACKDIFQLQTDDEDEPKSDDIRPTQSDQELCPDDDSHASEKLHGVEPDERHTHLARVFSELCSLYNIKTSNISEQEKCKDINDIRFSYMSEHKNASALNSQKNQSNEQKQVTIGRGDRPLYDFSVAQTVKRKQKVKRLVPRRLGWDWRRLPASKRGWRPGAIRRPIKKIMNFFLEDIPMASAVDKIDKFCNDEMKDNREPTMLHVCKKQGEISITFRSVDHAKKELPIIFTVTKSEKAVWLSGIKQKLKKCGFRKCNCHQSLMLCVCRTTQEKRVLQKAFENECALARIPYCPEELVLTDTSESDMDYDFEVSPIKSDAQIIPDTTHTFTKGSQTTDKDLIVNDIYPLCEFDSDESGNSDKENTYRRGKGNKFGWGGGKSKSRGGGKNNSRGGGKNKSRGGGKNKKGSGGKGRDVDQGKGIKVALPKRLQANPNAAAEAKLAAEQQKRKENQKVVMKKLIQMIKMPSISRKKTLRTLLAEIPPDIDNITKLGKGINECCYYDPLCHGNCYTDCCPCSCY